MIAFRSPARFGGVAVSGSAASRPRSASNVSTAVMIAVDDEPSAPGLPLQVLRGVAQPLGVLRERRRDVEGLGHELRELVQVEADRSQQHRQFDEAEQLGADALEELARR